MPLRRILHCNSVCKAARNCLDGPGGPVTQSRQLDQSLAPEGTWCTPSPLTKQQCYIMPSTPNAHECGVNTLLPPRRPPTIGFSSLLRLSLPYLLGLLTWDCMGPLAPLIVHSTIHSQSLLNQISSLSFLTPLSSPPLFIPMTCGSLQICC